MFNKLKAKFVSSDPQHLAGAFRRLGWTGFWLQLVLGTLPVLLLVYVVLFSKTKAMERGGVAFTAYLAVVGWLILAFTLFWTYNYTRLARRIADPDTRPSQGALVRVLWVGLLAGGLGVLVSMLLMTFEVSRMLFVFLRTPQGGMPVISTEAVDPINWISAVDMVGLLADLCVLGSELIVLALTLWLLFRVMQPAPAADTPQAVTED